MNKRLVLAVAMALAIASGAYAQIVSLNLSPETEWYRKMSVRDQQVFADGMRQGMWAMSSMLDLLVAEFGNDKDSLMSILFIVFKMGDAAFDLSVDDFMAMIAMPVLKPWQKSVAYELYCYTLEKVEGAK